MRLRRTESNQGNGRLAAMLPAVMALLLPGFAWASVVVNPYADVDWAAFEQHRANLHTHTTQSDGEGDPDVVIDTYHQLGYTILALTDHNRCTYPWQNWGRDPDALGMLAIAGNEPSRHHHLNSFFIAYETASTVFEQTVEEIAAAGGLAHINHPGRYWNLTGGEVPADALAGYVNWLNTYDILLGIEVINSFNRYPHDRVLWDALLSEMMPDRPVWGFSNDDMHALILAGLSYNVFLLPALTEADVREAMLKGQFYFCYIRTFNAADAPNTPTITAIDHDAGAGIIAISAVSSGAPLPDEDYQWISDGNVVHIGPVLNYRTTPGIGRYVRAELIGTGGTTFTNPFGFGGNGILRVDISPPAAADEGARWLVQGEPTWRESGEEIELPPGEYAVMFRPISGWLAPDPITVQVFSDLTTVVGEAEGAVYVFAPGHRLPAAGWGVRTALAIIIALCAGAWALRGGKCAPRRQ
ncbi:MAG TPA: hypothetical protein ENN65_09110 [Candidatus Hydrogenedentes bacterium]|nr:hypothetical protein [Candidatus Hydrogenedentota bacterium]